MNAKQYGPGIAFDLEDYWKRRAAQTLGADPSRLMGEFFPFGTKLQLGTQTTTYGSGVRDAVAMGLQLSSAGVANSGGIQDIAPFVSGVNMAKFIPTSATGKWWMGGRIRVNTAVGANLKCGFGGRSGSTTSNANTTDEFMLGVRGSVSTTNYVLYATAGVSINSGVAIDTSAHDIIAWRDGATTFVQVDNNAPVSGTARPNADSSFGAFLLEVDATLRTVDFFWGAAWSVMT